MLYSMTGFGSAQRKEGNVSIFVELKTVNNRYFKLSLRLTEGFAVLEQRIETCLRRVIERGSVNAHIRIVQTEEDFGSQINTEVLQSYIKQLTEIAQTAGQDNYRPALEPLLVLPGVIALQDEHERNEGEIETIGTLLEKTLGDALSAVQTMRKAEGESMEKNLTENIEILRRLLGNITARAPQVVPQYLQKLKERIEKAMGEHAESLNDADFIRELALFTDRCDISEELVRFQSHLEQFISAIQSKESCGRKLDFLTQELVREANTIGSKANDAEITIHVVEIKAVIERMKEMVQNVE